MHKDKYLEIRDSIIQSISPEGLKLQTYNLLWIYSCLIATDDKATHSTMYS